MINNILIATFSLLLCSCNSDKTNDFQVDDDVSQNDQEIVNDPFVILELRGRALFESKKAVSRWENKELRQANQLRELTGAGESALLLEELRATRGRLKEAKEWQTDSIREWLHTTINYKEKLDEEERIVPDYWTIISYYGKDLDHAMKQNNLPIADGDWKARMDEYYRLLNLEFEEVLHIYTVE